MNKALGSLLILAVTAVLLSLLFAGHLPFLAIVAVTIVLVTMILVIGGAPELLPCVLRIMLSEMRRMIRP
jgi:hypothetical protein